MASWKRGRVPSEAMDVGRVLHFVIASGNKLFFMSLPCSSLFDSGGGIQVAALVLVSHGW